MINSSIHYCSISVSSCQVLFEKLKSISQVLKTYHLQSTPKVIGFVFMYTLAIYHKLAIVAFVFNASAKLLIFLSLHNTSSINIPSSKALGLSSPMYRRKALAILGVLFQSPTDQLQLQ